MRPTKYSGKKENRVRNGQRIIASLPNEIKKIRKQKEKQNG